MKFAQCLLPFLLTLRAVPAAADTLTDLLPPNTKMVIGIRVHNLALSSVAQTFAAQAQAATAGWLKAVPLDGIDLLRDIDEVLIASSGKGQNPQYIIVVAGRFDFSRLAEGAKLYRHVPLLTGEAESSGAVALLENGAAILGDVPLVRAAIDQRANKSRIDRALNDRITSLRQRYDIWGLGERPEGFVAPVPEAKVLESIDRFQFGMQLASGLELSAEVHPRSPEGIERLNAALDTIAAIVTGHVTSSSAAKFDRQTDGGTLKLSVFIPEEELKKTIEAETAIFSPVSTQLPAERPTAVTSPETPETGPNTAADAAPVAPALAQASSKPSPKAHDKEKDTDTVVVMLPGKK